MRESHKSKRVSWASDVSLCQIRLFLSEDTPAQVGLDCQDHLQAKTSWLSHQPGTPSSDDVLPPGFEAAHPPNLLLAHIPTMEWKCPPRFVLEVTWQVVGGEESEEAGIQNEREMRVLEAIYPRPSAIPPNPSLTVTPSTEDISEEEANTLPIPITAMEDEDAAAPSSSSLIDHDLLVKILSNPEMVEKLVTGYAAPDTVAPASKDMNYYKSLIHEHGREAGPQRSKVKIMKPCIYFNSSRGCRHGANCTYQHHHNGPDPKRPKFDRQISS